MREIVISHADELQSLVRDTIGLLCSKQQAVRIAVPGGRSVAFVIKGLLELSDDDLKKVQLYLVDERLSGQRNVDTLLDAGLGEAFQNDRMARTQLFVPDPTNGFDEGDLFDLVYLGVGEDGHVASLFPDSYSELSQPVTGEIALISNSVKPPPERHTVTFYGFEKRARNATIYLLFLGESKRYALSKLTDQNESAMTFPYRFFIDNQYDVCVVTDLKEQRR
ncbi:MAG: 6-phosphogluconolactonase [Sphaerochaetaceae bacterium]|jgi:6-phosphogluconolactonase/glucosamine-6-phosphate isomerase/deaminase|nr:6-phosphogluconolactonase [Sphaerochaetaceae bacterium]NLO59942.1 hypothetical protein [Spirochaetales bacterium]MDD2405502.1 6-phosphogluconolactonase [Sphaerochaetaceae bacterium]MDD4258951.1 6-phosphogluconolactonase [Sphaerochaetaceae bacterium]MDD4840678.1 6-phosphogluconolactonase [Sphaerochaetaceae bacterium]